MKHINPDNFKVMPWKNGGGITNEIYRIPDKDDFFLRVSMAQVAQDGPFSIFTNIDRVLKIIEGDGCILNSETKLLTSSASYAFAGEEKIFCSLINGPIIDFNIMVKRDWARVKCEEVLNNEESTYKAEADLLMIFDIKSKHFWVLNKGEATNISTGHFFLTYVHYLTVK